MDVQQLRSFRSVVATGSVRGAAEALGYSPSAVSQQVATLQRAAGVPLLSRVGRGVEPTRAGWALAERIDGVLGELGDLDGFVRALREGRGATLVLAYFSSLGTTWLPDIVGPLVREFPDTRIGLAMTDVFDPTRRPRPDVQLIVAPESAAAPDGYERHLLTRDAYVVALPQDHPFVGRESVPLVELADQAWIDNDFAQGTCRRVVLDACAAVGFQPRFRIEAHDYASALGLVSTGIGISVMPSLGAQQLPPGVLARPVVDPTPVRSIHALVLRDSADTPAVTRCLELIREAARGPAHRVLKNVVVSG